MYVVFGNQIVDSEEIRDSIEANSGFEVIKDMSKGTKREDVVAFNISINIDNLNNIIKEEYDMEELDEEELFDEYMTFADDLAMQLEEYMPEESLLEARAYKWDHSDNDIKLVIAVCNEELGETKLRDVTKRLLTQVD